jgi:hypothetical protein
MMIFFPIFSTLAHFELTLIYVQTKKVLSFLKFFHTFISLTPYNFIIIYSRKRILTMERCMSCNSKRTMSRSSTLTDNTQSICFGSSSFKGSTMDNHQRIIQQKSNVMDRISMRSQESCGNFSEFSISRPYHQHSHETTSQRSFSVPRSVRDPPRSFVGSYENYDSPKILSPSNENNHQIENYDRPRNVKMYLEQKVGGKLSVFNASTTGEYGNYDTPAIQPKSIVCGCLGGNNAVQSRISSADDSRQESCTCHRVMSWADNWMPCRRGSGIENTSVPVNHMVTASGVVIPAQDPNKCKLADFSNINTDKSGLYALVDPSKKQMKRLTNDGKPPPVPRTVTTTPSAFPNYANLEFEKSLEIYENAKDVLKRENIFDKQLPPIPNGETEEGEEEEENDKENNEKNVLVPSAQAKTDNENYLVMEIQEKQKRFSGYISMHPVNSNKTTTTSSTMNEPKRDATLPLIHKSKKVLLLLEEKSHSNPDLNRPICLEFKRHTSLADAAKADRSSDYKLIFKKSSSVDSFRYLENDDATPTIIEDEQNSTASTCTYQNVTKSIEIPTTNTSQEHNNNNINKNFVKQPHEHINIGTVRLADCPPNNRDSSSSNDSGVSTASVVPKSEFNEFELPLINQIKKRRQLNQNNKPCVHSSLIRRSKSSDPFGDLQFQFAHNKKIASNASSLPNKSNKCPSLGAIMTAGHIDSNSTSSGTSDMSDYIETLSLSSHSSSDVEAMR